MFWQTFLSILVSVLFGAVTGVVTYLYAGDAEALRQLQVRKVDAYVNFAKLAFDMDTDSPEFRSEFPRARMYVALYADDAVMAAYNDHNKCGLQTGYDSEACKRTWAEFINVMRNSLGSASANTPSIAGFLYGS